MLEKKQDSFLSGMELRDMDGCSWGCFDQLDCVYIFCEYE